MRQLLIITLILITIGLVMIYSTSAIFAQDKFGDQYYFFKRQLIWAGFGAIAMVIAALVPLRIVEEYSKFLLFLTGGLLLLVLLPGVGTEIGGARRWFRFAGLSFQPAEMAKLAVVMYSACFLSRRAEKKPACSSKNAGFPELRLVLLHAAILVLILMQPDLGTAVLIGVIVFIVMFLGGVNLGYLLAMVACALPAVAILILKADYRLERVLVFLNPWADPRDAGYQITQSFIALGSGGISGIGLGGSLQKLYYLPESFTDFIFSIIGEETGFIGTASIVILFVLFVCHGIRVSIRAGDSFAFLLGTGITVMIGLQAVIHMGVVTGCLPTKGLPLPFLSCGGSSLLASMAGVGLLLNISRKRKLKLS